MPIPSPQPNEKKKDFISRCMADSVMRREWPAQDQRAAVCSRRYSKGKSAARK